MDIVETTMELLQKIDTAKDGDVCECKETKSTYVFRDKGWDCIKTKQKGYEELYGSKQEH